MRNALLPLLLAAIVAVATPCAAHAADALDAEIAAIGHRWASAAYSTPETGRADALKAALVDADATAARYPDRAEPKVWQAIVLASLAKVEGGLGALGKAKKARDVLIAAQKIDAGAMDGSIYATLGSLYANVPGWPIGFGDDDKARSNFEQALRVDPANIDSNYFYGAFLADQGDYANAARYLDHAINAPPRPGREDADAGRRGEARALLSMLHARHASAFAEN